MSFAGETMITLAISREYDPSLQEINAVFAELEALIEGAGATVLRRQASNSHTNVDSVEEVFFRVYFSGDTESVATVLNTPVDVIADAIEAMNTSMIIIPRPLAMMIPTASADFALYVHVNVSLSVFSPTEFFRDLRNDLMFYGITVNTQRSRNITAVDQSLLLRINFAVSTEIAVVTNTVFTTLLTKVDASVRRRNSGNRHMVVAQHPAPILYDMRRALCYDSLYPVFARNGSWFEATWQGEARNISLPVVWEAGEFDTDYNVSLLYDISTVPLWSGPYMDTAATCPLGTCNIADVERDDYCVSYRAPRERDDNGMTESEIVLVSAIAGFAGLVLIIVIVVAVNRARRRVGIKDDLADASNDLRPMMRFQQDPINQTVV